jgi:ribose transport system substrate-binding protein
MLKKILLAGAALGLALGLSQPGAQAKDLKSLGISLGSLGNPFFIALARGATDEAKTSDPTVRVTTLGYDYDLGKQFTQIDNFIAAGESLILLNPGDPHAILPAIKKAQAAGIPVVSVDTVAEGSDATVATNNVQAGTIACEYLLQQMGNKGNLLIVNGPQVSSVIDRVNGCKAVVAQHPEVKILSSDQDAKGSRDGGLSVGQTLLTRFPKVDGAFAINDPEAIGFALAAKQQGRTDFPVVSVDGSPDIEAALKDPGLAMIKASASQDPYIMARKAVAAGIGILNGKPPAEKVTLLPSVLVTRENVKDYKGWSSPRS